MSDQAAEEQQMEAEALEAIFEDLFTVIQSTPTQQWAVQIYPETGCENSTALDELNHVACELQISLPDNYPDDDDAIPELTIKIIKGLAPEHADILHQLAVSEATANAGLPCVYAVAERLREWLADHNEKGLDDTSMYAQSMRKQQEQKKKAANAMVEYEAQVQQENVVDMEDIIHRRRVEGTPCTLENFLAWRERFNAEMVAVEENNHHEKKETEKKDKPVRLTGFQFFNQKSGLNLEALEAAAEEAEQAEMSGDDDKEDVDVVDEELFDDDVDLDDLDFDDDDDEEEEEDLDI